MVNHDVDQSCVQIGFRSHSRVCDGLDVISTQFYEAWDRGNGISTLRAYVFRMDLSNNLKLIIVSRGSSCCCAAGGAVLADP